MENIYKLNSKFSSISVKNGIKKFRSPAYNYNFDIKTGVFQRWGAALADNPSWSPYGPEIADIELTTSCAGPLMSNGKNKLCSFCYKSNNPVGSNMTIGTFAKLLDKFPHVVNEQGKKIFFLTQMAAGVDAECKSNPDVWKIFQHCRDNGIVPNLTVASISDETAKNIASLCGACAVSRYDDKDVCYNSVDLLSHKYGMKQTNIHMLLAKSTLDNVWQTLEDIQVDSRLKDLNAIVFLSLKQKGRGVNQEPIGQENYSKIVQYCLDKKIRFGADSCGAGRLLKSLNPQQYDKILPVVEPCESTCMSFYCDVRGMYYPCSFMEGVGDWVQGINMLEVNDFIKEVWCAPKTQAFRSRVQKCNECLGGCCHYKI